MEDKVMNEGKLTTVEGDVTNPQRTAPNEIVMIVHCCNNKNAWGAGVTSSISKKWKEPEKTYKAFCEGNLPFPKSNSREPILGQTCYAKIDNHLVIANMIGQDGTVSQDNPKPIKYWALANAMREVVSYIGMIQSQTSNPVVIHAPKFGSDLAKGDWNFILELIREIWLEHGIDVVIYEFKK